MNPIVHASYRRINGLSTNSRSSSGRNKEKPPEYSSGMGLEPKLFVNSHQRGAELAGIGLGKNGNCVIDHVQASLEISGLSGFGRRAKERGCRTKDVFGNLLQMFQLMLQSFAGHRGLRGTIPRNTYERAAASKATPRLISRQDRDSMVAYGTRCLAGFSILSSMWKSARNTSHRRWRNHAMLG